MIDSSTHIGYTDKWKEETMTEAQKRAKTKYDAQNTKMYSLKLNTNTDADIINMLDASGNVQGTLKRLLNEELGRRTK